MSLPIHPPIPSDDGTWPPKTSAWPPWPGDDGTSAPPNEYNDFARRFMLLSWAVANHRAALGNYPVGWPFFDLRFPAYFVTYLVNAAIRWLATSWFTHWHSGSLYFDAASYKQACTQVGGVGNPYVSINYNLANGYSTSTFSFRKNVTGTGANGYLVFRVNNAAGYTIDTIWVYLVTNGPAISFGAGNFPQTFANDTWYDIRTTVEQVGAQYRISVYLNEALVGVYTAAASLDQFSNALNVYTTVATGNTGSITIHSDAVAYLLNGAWTKKDNTPNTVFFSAAPPATEFHGAVTDTFRPSPVPSGDTSSTFGEIPEFQFVDLTVPSLNEGLAWLSTVEQLVYSHIGGL